MSIPKVTEEISELYRSHFGNSPSSIHKLPESGSDRFYFRVKGNPGCIATINENTRENETFVYFTRVFREAGIPVPEVYAVSNGKKLYLQEDLGNESLLTVLDREGHTGHVKELYMKSLASLARMQVAGAGKIDFTKCITSQEFGKQAILNDLLYFKYYFLDTLKHPYDKEQLLRDFESLSENLAAGNSGYFLFRDFQSRNIMVKNDEVFFIDYQGGMKGALQYDVASLLWQARATLPTQWKRDLLQFYYEEVNKLIPGIPAFGTFKEQYEGYVLIRLLQVLGAYGFRGLFERKAHFLASLPLALANLTEFLGNYSPMDTPEFNRILEFVSGDEVKKRFEIPRANSATPLTVSINSFSFIQRGYPPDVSGNGGGFVFDCRGLLNPGRIDEYKALTGRDKPVQDYIEQQTKMNDFLQSVYNVVDIAVEDYIRRDFNSLVVNFGCTGGRHRSVYAADALARHLRNKYGVRTIVSHLEQNIQEVKECPYP